MNITCLLLQVQSRKEILADKYVALAFRDRVKNRDLWDVLWLQRQGVKLPVPLLADKVNDHLRDVNSFLTELKKRSNQFKKG